MVLSPSEGLHPAFCHNANELILLVSNHHPGDEVHGQSHVPVEIIDNLKST